MTIKVKYEQGYLKVQEKNVDFKEGQEYEVEVTPLPANGLKTVRAERLKNITGIVSLGGDAVKDRKNLYE